MVNTLDSLNDALAGLKAEKPNDRSDKDRYFSILITDLEKVIALYKAWS
jgi:hypothetical protein